MLYVTILVGASNGIYLTMDTSLAVDTISIDNDNDNNTKKTNGINQNEIMNTNTRSDDDHGTAQLFGIWGVFGFLGSALGPLIGGTALLVYGNIPTSVSSTISSTGKESNDDTILQSLTTSTSTGIATTTATPFYKLQGYQALFSLSAFYFICSAISLGFVRKKGV